jgi:UDP-N-acetylmuramoyl-L-alanyl-D-glutamate--2,6-diaminopimelate ligase
LLLSQITDSNENVEIKGITADSRQVREGYLFAALPGSTANGQQFIEDAIRHGAVAILGGEDATIPAGSDAVLIKDENPRLALAHIAANYYDIQPKHIVAVTGTSGKTSTVNFTQHIWELAGITQSASLGTLGVRGPGLIRSGSLTTPDTVSLHAELADLAAAGITHLAMEASSHGLDQFRLDGVNIKVAGYANLSRDHLDYHADMEEYFMAKSRLFTEVLGHGDIAVINADDEYGPRLIAMTKLAGRNVLSFGEKGEHIRLISINAQPMGQDISIEVFGKQYDVTIPLVGRFQTMNVLLALGLVIASGIGEEKVIPLLSQLRGVPGRLQLVPGHPKNAAIYIDYAHKPAAVEAVLNTLRPHTEGRLICVLGCGGNRDAGKRPIMGKVASELSDLAIITDDNPRNEDPALIRMAMMAGANEAKGAKEIAGRGEAIAWAVRELKDGDVLVIAGKGHESGQIIGDVVEPFDDATEAQKTINELNKNKGV